MKRLSLISMVVLTAITGVALLVRAQDDNRPPFVSNVHTEQRPGTKLVDISYDVDDPDGDLLTITVAVSDDGGSTFTVPATSFTGDVGSGIAPGAGKQIVWDAGADVPNVYGVNYRVKITANDGVAGAPMALIPAGEFQMGDAFSEGDPDERPVHTVYLDAFYIDVYEVTNAQYGQFMESTGHRTPSHWNDLTFNAPEQPVVGVDWNDAKAYCEWAGKRLPTEAEWEKAARGGLVGKRYPWGDDVSHNDANYSGTGGKDIWSDWAGPVGSFSPNGYGLYDMAGNVWEWCSDWYDSGYYARSPRENPKGANSSSYRVLRGGSWVSYSSILRAASRVWSGPSRRFSDYGFRCVQDSF